MKCWAENLFLNLYMYCTVGEKEAAEKRMLLTHVRDITSSSDNFKEIKWKLKGSILEQKSQKHLKIWNIRKAQHLPAVGGQLLSWPAHKAQRAKPESAPSHQDSVWCTSKAVPECRRTSRADSSFQQGKALKSQHLEKKGEELGHLDFLISVSHGLAKPSVGCAQWSSTKTQLSLGCHSLAMAPCGLSFSRAVLSFFLCLTHFSLCPSQGYFHPSQFCHAGDRGRCDMTPLYFLWTPTMHVIPKIRQPLQPDTERIHRGAHQHLSRRTMSVFCNKAEGKTPVCFHFLRNTSQKKPHKRVSHP